MARHEQQTLSTGMGNLDSKFVGGGLQPGSVVTVRSPPSALGQVVLYNLSAGRPTTYISIGPSDARTETLLVEAGGLDPAALSIEEIPAKDAAETLDARLETFEFADGETLLIEPINLVEASVDKTEYAGLLARLSNRVKRTDGLCGLLAIESEPTPENRWQTVHESETVLTVLHEVSSRNVHNHLALEKLHPRQELRDADDRVFRLPRSLEIDIDTKKNLSP